MKVILNLMDSQWIYLFRIILNKQSVYAIVHFDIIVKCWLIHPSVHRGPIGRIFSESIQLLILTILQQHKMGQHLTSFADRFVFKLWLLTD